MNIYWGIASLIMSVGVFGVGFYSGACFVINNLKKITGRAVTDLMREEMQNRSKGQG